MQSGKWMLAGRFSVYGECPNLKMGMIMEVSAKTVIYLKFKFIKCMWTQLFYFFPKTPELCVNPFYGFHVSPMIWAPHSASTSQGILEGWPRRWLEQESLDSRRENHWHQQDHLPDYQPCIGWNLQDLLSWPFSSIKYSIVNYSRCTVH